MNSDTPWVVFRYLTIAVGSFFAGKGYVMMDQVQTVVEKAPEIVGAISAAGAAVWGLWVRWNTKAVPLATAARNDVPTVSAATGAVDPATSARKK